VFPNWFHEVRIPVLDITWAEEFEQNSHINN
jgi:hypothetical protein